MSPPPLFGGSLRLCPYYVNNQHQQLEKVTQEKDLGILISNDLKVSQQCQSACSKAMRIMGIINRTIVFRHADIMLRLYKTICHWSDPILNTVQHTATWSPHYCKDKKTD